MLNEQWKDIPNLPYEISNNGVVRRKEGSHYNWKNKTQVRTYLSNRGYQCVHLYKNSKCYRFQIHRLLAELFIPNPSNKAEVNHIDGNPLNNNLSNLEWVTHQENIVHAYKNGLVKADRNLTQRVKRKNASSSYRGVNYDTKREKWFVSFKWKKKTIYVGRFKDELEAAKAYDSKVKELGLDVQGCPLNFS